MGDISISYKKELAFDKAREEYANALFNDHYNLKDINIRCGFGWELKEEQERITEDSCFIFPYLQNCHLPAYRISHINLNGTFKIYGKGSWCGFAKDEVSLYNLVNTHELDKLFTA